MTAAAAVRAHGLSVGQGAAVAAVAGTRRLEVIEGPAGSGKTRMLAAAREHVEASGRQLRIFGASRQAAVVAAAEVGTGDGSSVHALLFQYGWRWDDADRWTRLTAGDLCPVTEKVYTGPRPDMSLSAGTVAVVDEAGMLSVPAAAALTDVAAQSGAALRLVGDRRQLGPVGRGGVLDAAARWAEDPVALDTVHRFTRTILDPQGWPVTVVDDDYAQLTLAMRERRDPGAVADALHGRGQVVWHPDRDAMLDAVTAEVAAGAGAPGRVAVTAATNADVHDVNDRIRAARVHAGTVDDDQTVVGRDGDRIGAGDAVVTRRNDATLDVSNRQSWTVTAVHDTGELTVTSNATTSAGGGGRVVRLPADYVHAHVGLGYAATAHGNQGVTTDRAVGVVSDATDAGGLYVQLTRGRAGNTAHLVAEDWAGAREQLIRALDRDRGDRGLDAAATAAYTESVPRPDLSPTRTPGPVDPATTAQPELQPQPGHGERVEALLAQLQTAWTAQDRARQALDELEPRLVTARADAARQARVAQILAPLVQDMTATAAVAAAARERAVPARAELSGRVEQIRDALHAAWEEQRPAAVHAAQVIRAGTGRFGRGRTEIHTQHDALTEWGQRWAPVIPALADPATAVRYAEQHPAMNRVEGDFARYADTRAAAELPAQVAAVAAAHTAAAAAQQAKAVHDQAVTGLRQQQALQRSYHGWRDVAGDLERLTTRADHARQTLTAADTVITAVTTDPVIANRPDRDQLLTGARTTWTADRATTELASAAAAQQAAHDHAARDATQRMHDHHHSPTTNPDHGISR